MLEPQIPVSIVVISKDEQALADTLIALASSVHDGSEVIVVDASADRLHAVRDAHPWVRWIQFVAPPGVRISIPHQRNAGVAAAGHDVIVFTDAGCVPEADWLPRLLRPLIEDGESVTCGSTVSPQRDIYGGRARRTAEEYLSEAPTINIAIRREVFATVGPFDESFEYGSDVDWTWRAVDSGLRLRHVPDAVVAHGWGNVRRQLKRAYRYGAARARLYVRHPGRLRGIVRRDPIAVVYPVFLLALPLLRWFPAYPLLLVVPLWRNRRIHPVLTVADHLAYGVGVLSTLARLVAGRLR